MKRMSHLLLYCLLTIVLFSCKTPIDVTGTYSSLFRNNSQRLDISTIHKIVLNIDSTFNYFYIVMGDAEKYSSGTWKRIDKKTIVLNSDVSSSIIPLNVEVSSASDYKNPMINVKLIIPGKDEKEYRCTPYYVFNENFSMESFLPDRGSYSYEGVNTKNHILFFKVSKEPRTFEMIGPRPFKKYYVLETDHKAITMNGGDIVDVTVTVQDSLFSYRVFNNEKIKYNGNKLIFKNSEEKNKKYKLYLNE